MGDYRLIAPELFVLSQIADQMRQLSKGIASGRTPIAAVVAERSGLSQSPSLRALLALPDLRRPRPDTLDAIAGALGRPELGLTWRQAWDSVEHPEVRS